MFYTDDKNYVDAGILRAYNRVVPINTIDKIYGFSDPINDLLSIGKGYADTMSIFYKGLNIPFFVSGSNQFETFNINVNPPKKKVELIQPKDEEEIETQNEYIIKWNSGSDITSNIRIIISNGLNKQITIFGKDKGEYKLEKSNMNYLGTGKFIIEILSGNYSIIKLKTGYYAIAIVGSSYQTTVYIK